MQYEPLLAGSPYSNYRIFDWYGLYGDGTTGQPYLLVSYSAGPFSELPGSAAAGSESVGPSSASIIPTIGNAFVLDTTDRMPASRACFSKSLLACCVNSTMGTAGAISDMRRAASIPLIPGI